MGLAVGLRENHRRRIAVGAPFGKDFARQITEVILVLRIQAKHGHGIPDYAAVHIGKAGNLEAKLLLRLFHGEGVVAALKMFVGQYAAAHNGQVRVRPKEIVGELLHKGKQLIEHSPVNDHGRVPGVHDDAVLIIINVGRILEAPELAVHHYRHDPQVLPRRVGNGSRIAHVFGAEQTLGVTGGLFQLRRRDVPGVFFRFGQVDGDLQLPVFGLRRPALVLRDAVAADVVAVLTEGVEVVRRRLGGLGIPRPELPHHLRRAGRQEAHELRVEQVAFGDGIRDHPLLGGVIAQQIQALREIKVLLLLFVTLQPQFRKKGIPCERLVQRVEKAAVFRVIQQRIQRRPNSFSRHSHGDAPCASSMRNQ